MCATSNPLAKKQRIEGNSDDATTSTDDSSPGTWSFSFDDAYTILIKLFHEMIFAKVAYVFQLCTEEEDLTIDMKTFLDNQKKTYDRIVSQISQDAQISMSSSMLLTAEQNVP